MGHKYWITKTIWERIRIRWIDPIVWFIYWNSSKKRIQRRKKIESTFKRILKYDLMPARILAYELHQKALFREIKELRERLKDGGK